MTVEAAQPADPDLRMELLHRRDRDQAIRTTIPKREPWPEHIRQECRRVDADNTTFMKSVITEHGWPGHELVAEDGARAAWLLVQHADQDPQFQAACLELLRAAVAAGQARPAELAYLTDRVRVAQGRPQPYGTQYGPSGPHPIEDPEHLDERRAQVGLGPHAEYDRTVRGIA